MRRQLAFVGFVMFMATLLVASVCPAATLTCSWDPSPEADLAGYRLFQRTAGSNYDYNTPVAEIPAGKEVCTLTNVPDGDYRWILRAFDTAGNESGDSAEATHLVDDPPGVVTGFG